MDLEKIFEKGRELFGEIALRFEAGEELKDIVRDYPLLREGLGLSEMKIGYFMDRYFEEGYS